MVLLVKIQESAIVENLKKRYLDDLIFVSFINTAHIHHVYYTIQCMNTQEETMYEIINDRCCYPTVF